MFHTPFVKRLKFAAPMHIIEYRVVFARRLVQHEGHYVGVAAALNCLPQVLGAVVLGELD
jgi:hypothetical protein